MTIRMTRRESRWRVAPLALRFWRGQRTAWLSAEADASLKGGQGGDVTELWTFMRARGGNWLLSAIQQT